MADLRSAYLGCLLGLAMGDALGHTVDEKTYEEICADYGPEGLLGYDLANGHPQISAHTQITAYVTNGLLLGITHEQRGRRSAPYTQYVALALREWVHTQRYHQPLTQSRCWVYRTEELRGKSCSDPRLVETLHLEGLGTLEKPINRQSSSAALCAAIPVGIFFHPDRMEPEDVGILGAEALALTQGSPLAFLSGAALAYMIAGIVQEPERSLADHCSFAARAMAGQFDAEYPQAKELYVLLRKAIQSAVKKTKEPHEVMQQLRCETAAQVLAGAVYAAIASEGDFDKAMIIAVNHSGRSAAVGAVTGALLGTQLGAEALPEFYREGMDCGFILQTLAEDLTQSCLNGTGLRLFDDEWDDRYMRGIPPTPQEDTDSSLPDFLV